MAGPGRAISSALSGAGKGGDRDCPAATWLKRAQSAAISWRCARRRAPLGRAERVLDQRVLLHDGPDDAGRHLNGGDELGRPRQDLVGWTPSPSSDSTPPARAQARASPPTTATASLSPLATMAQRVVDDLLLGDADFAEHGAGARRAPIRRATVRAGSVSDHEPWGTRTWSRPASRPGAPASSAAGTHGARHELAHRRAVVGRPEADEHGAARVQACAGVRSRPPMLRSGDGDRRCGQVGGRALGLHQGELRGGGQASAPCSGSAPARPSIIMSEAPGISPELAVFARRVVAAGMHGGRAAPLRRRRPAHDRALLAAHARAGLHLAGVLVLRPEADEPDHQLAARPGRRRSTSAAAAPVSVPSACASPAASRWP